METEPQPRKDGWDKAAIVLHPLGGLLAALAVAGLGFFGSQFLERRQAEETRARFYSELISKREEADSALRKDMFMSIIQSFLRPESASIDDRIVKLELLAYNFHESLNLKPLFVQLANDIARSASPAKAEYADRLEKVAREVVRKEMVVLEGVGASFDRSVDFEDVAGTPGGLALEPGSLTLDGVTRELGIVVKGVNVATKELQLRVEVKTPREGFSELETDEAEFWVDYFDFPMIDHVRLSRDQRCAAVIRNYGKASARLSLVLFPGSYASLKEKPYIQEMIRDLLGAGETAGRR
ncbi:MAG: hypothetical protein EDX89_04325 [Acidobacteria bacterium]|nr:MAG: hypothetical protein EDX89_04325 [Acidobacteriota bacterium]MCE7959241.1 hypothetical protein [Acidobacteria bacterium ACB2]